MHRRETLAVGAQQRQFLQTQGYLVLTDITTDEEIGRLRQACDLLLALHTGHASDYRGDLAGVDASLADTGRILLTDPERYHQAFGGTLFAANALQIARLLVGGDPELRGTCLLYKPARMGSPTPWHQEEAYLAPGRTYDLLTFWLALQDTPVESGCMQFVPGSHRWETLPHTRWPGSARDIVLAADPSLFDATRAIACPLPQGGATVHTSRTLHYAGPNLAEVARRAFILDIAYAREPGGEEESR